MYGICSGLGKMKMKMKIVVLSLFLFTVMTGYAQQKRYPYVQDGKIIVCREGTDGVISSLIHPNWTTTPSHDETDAANNRFAAKFEVAAQGILVDNGFNSILSDAVRRCASYSESSGDAGTWRLPTIRELKLIYALRDELTNISSFSSPSYFSYTEDSANNNNVWCLGTSYRRECRSIPKTTYNNVHVLCIRDL